MLRAVVALALLAVAGSAGADVLGAPWCGSESEGFHVPTSPGYLVCVHAEPVCAGSLACTPRVCVGVHDFFLLPC